MLLVFYQKLSLRKYSFCFYLNKIFNLALIISLDKHTELLGAFKISSNLRRKHQLCTSSSFCWQWWFTCVQSPVCLMVQQRLSRVFKTPDWLLMYGPIHLKAIYLLVFSLLRKWRVQVIKSSEWVSYWSSYLFLAFYF